MLNLPEIYKLFDIIIWEFEPFCEISDSKVKLLLGHSPNCVKCNFIALYYSYRVATNSHQIEEMNQTVNNFCMNSVKGKIG